MKKKLNVFCILMLTAVLSYCQSIYPIKTVIDSDTVCIISIAQVREINTTYLLCDQYQDMSAQYMTLYSISQQKCEEQEALIKAMEQKLLLSNEIIKEKDNTIIVIDKSRKRDARQITWLKFERTLLCAILVGSAAYLVVK